METLLSKRPPVFLLAIALAASLAGCGGGGGGGGDIQGIASQGKEFFPTDHDSGFENGSSAFACDDEPAIAADNTRAVYKKFGITLPGNPGDLEVTGLSIRLLARNGADPRAMSFFDVTPRIVTSPTAAREGRTARVPAAEESFTSEFASAAVGGPADTLGLKPSVAELADRLFEVVVASQNASAADPLNELDCIGVTVYTRRTNVSTDAKVPTVSCTDDSGCSESQFCENDSGDTIKVCHHSPRTCQPQGGSGACCDRDAECRPDHFCQLGPSPTCGYDANTCNPQGDVGACCDQSVECRPGLDCIANSCVETGLP